MVRVILFGAGNLLSETIGYLNKSKVKIVAICDNDKSKWGKKQYGKNIISPCELRNKRYDVIVISNVKYQDSIKKQLHGMGIKKVLPIYAQHFNECEKRLYDYCVNLRGKLVLKHKRYVQKQTFFPGLIGIWYNPYYFSRKGLAKCIEKYHTYVKGRCMDFGCGTKPYESLFDVTEYVGVEIDTEDKVDGIVYYDGKTLPFEDEYFDSIVAFQVYEHVSNLDEMVEELRRVLKMDGYMFITMPFAYPEHLVPYDFRRFTSYGIKQYLTQRGFEIVCYEKSGNFIETLAQMKNVYINETLFGDKWEKLKKMLCFICNFKGKVYSAILPNGKEFYLDNIVIVRKI